MLKRTVLAATLALALTCPLVAYAYESGEIVDPLTFTTSASTAQVMGEYGCSVCLSKNTVAANTHIDLDDGEALAQHVVGLEILNPSAGGSGEGAVASNVRIAIGLSLAAGEPLEGHVMGSDGKNPLAGPVGPRGAWAIAIGQTIDTSEIDSSSWELGQGSATLPGLLCAA